MKTSNFQTFRLRGVDDRWRVSADTASDIREMSWDLNDGWRSAGGYDSVSLDNGDSMLNWASAGRITSLHWYSRHNGASRYTIFETETGGLVKLNPRGFEGAGAAGRFKKPVVGWHCQESICAECGKRRVSVGYFWWSNLHY